MSSDFLDVLEVADLADIPEHIAKFMHREQAPSTDTQSWSFYAFGYERGFEQLAEVALKRWPGGDYMRMPLFFLCRHSIELHVKNAIRSFAGRSGAEIRLIGHNLLVLWRQMLEQVQAAGWTCDDEWTGYCTKLVEHISEADPDGERFRYPFNIRDIPFEYTRVELEGLVKAHEFITAYCDACISMLEENSPC